MNGRNGWHHTPVAMLLLLPLHIGLMGTSTCSRGDMDGDGWTTNEGDCDDDDSSVHPGAAEVCDGKDNDCNDLIDEGLDSDDDGTADCFDSEDCDGQDNDGDGVTDEDNVCDECSVEPDSCLSIWQAYARGEIEVATSSGGAGVTITNHSTYPICLDDQVLYTSDDTQSFFFDSAVVSEPVRVEPDQSFSMYYASWTTANNYYSPYSGSYGWWCVENGQTATSGGHYVYFGEAVPMAMADLINNDTDLDGDAVEDHVDWAGGSGVQTQYNVWGYQATHAAMTVGKTATGSGTEVEVTLVSRNVGALDAVGMVTDTTPKGWRLVAVSPQPDSQIDNGDGTTTMSFQVQAAGTYAGITGGGYVITYTLEKTAPTDTPFLHLGAASLTFNDGENDQQGESLDAAVYLLDADGDGTSACANQ